MADGKQTLGCGGWSDTKLADEHVQLVADKVKKQVEEKLGRSFTEYKAISYRDQLVSGMNYAIKVQVSSTGCIHIIVYENLQKEYTLLSVQDGKSLDDPIEIGLSVDQQNIIANCQVMADKKPLGAWSETKPADEHVQFVADKVKKQVEEKLGRSFTEYKAISYRDQLVSGMNYAIKVQVSSTEYIHIIVYENLQKEYTLLSVKDGKSLNDPIETDF